MPGLSNFLENKILDLFFGNTAYTIPATYHVALFTVAPDFELGTGGTEVSGGGYARASVTNNTTNFPASSVGTATKQNGTAITFVTPTASWGTVVAFGIYDASTAGNFLFGASLATSKTINSGDPVSFPINNLSITLD